MTHKLYTTITDHSTHIKITTRMVFENLDQLEEFMKLQQENYMRTLKQRDDCMFIETDDGNIIVPRHIIETSTIRFRICDLNED